MVDIERFRSLLAEATPTPWRVEESKYVKGYYVVGHDNKGLMHATETSGPDALLVSETINGLYDLLNELVETREESVRNLRYAEAIRKQWRLAEEYGDILEKRVDAALGAVGVLENGEAVLTLNETLRLVREILMGDVSIDL